MKSVTAFVGSARKQGVTYRATRRFLDHLQSFGDVRSELVFLSEHDIGRVLKRVCADGFLRSVLSRIRELAPKAVSFYDTRRTFLLNQARLRFLRAKLDRPSGPAR